MMDDGDHQLCQDIPATPPTPVVMQITTKPPITRPPRSIIPPISNEDHAKYLDLRKQLTAPIEHLGRLRLEIDPDDILTIEYCDYTAENLLRTYFHEACTRTRNNFLSPLNQRFTIPVSGFPVYLFDINERDINHIRRLLKLAADHRLKIKWIQLSSLDDHGDFRVNDEKTKSAWNIYLKYYDEAVCNS